MKGIVNYFSLFTSFSTLVCCALPSLFVALGAGAALVGMTSAFPQLIWISENKTLFFIFGAVLLSIGGFLQWRAKDEPCPIDPEKAKACMSARRWSLGIYFFSLSIYGIGAFFAYVAPLFLT